MQNLTTFLTRIQTFDLQVIPEQKLMHAPAPDEVDTSPAYSLSHQTDHGSYTFRSELNILKEMALIEIIAVDDKRIKKELDQLLKLKTRFNTFWKNFHEHHREWHGDYKPDYLTKINLYRLFIVNNLQSEGDLFIGEDFVEALNDSAKLRERLLTELIQEVERVLNSEETFEEWKTKQHTKRAAFSKDQRDSSVNPEVNIAVGQPRFTSGAAEAFLQVISSYFSKKQQVDLESLITKNTKPPTPLIFQGNGNQLADAFKQLYEANLIVGCKKTELEKWIVPNFLYVYNNNAFKSYTEGWLNGIISSDSKPCKSPILEVKINEGHFIIAPTLRNKRNNKY